MDKYYSIYQDKRMLERVHLVDGVPDFNNVEKVVEVRGFHERYVLDGDDDIPSINRCHILGIPEPGVFCQGNKPVNGRIQIGLNSGVIKRGGNAIRFYLPPGTVSLGLNMHFQNGRGEVPIWYRVGKEPDHLYMEDVKRDVPIAPSGTHRIVVPATSNFIKLSDIKNEQPPSETGHWVYIKFTTFSEYEAMVNVPLIQIRALVNMSIFKQWFEETEWDEYGDPLEGSVSKPVNKNEAYFKDDILYIPEVRVDDNYFHDVTVKIDVENILSFKNGRK